MASIYTPDGTKVPLEVLRNLITFLLARVASDPHAAPFLAPVKALRSDWNPVAAKELELEEAITIAQAGATAADRGLDGASGLVKIAIHKGRKADLTLPVHKLYFGTESPSVFEKPKLSTQLVAMKTWPALLAKAEQPELVGLVATVVSAVNAGTAAEKTLADAVAERDAFRLGGERKKIFDKFNSLCAKTYGAIKALVHDHPELGLVSGYAESFFQRGPVARAEAAVTLDDAITEVKNLQDQLATATAQRDDLQAKETAHGAQMKNAEAAVLEAAALKKKSDEAELSAQAAVKAAKALAPTPAGKSTKSKKK